MNHVIHFGQQQDLFTLSLVQEFYMSKGFIGNHALLLLRDASYTIRPEFLSSCNPRGSNLRLMGGLIEGPLLKYIEV